MSWNLPLFIFFLLAGPFAYVAMSLLQPSGLTIFLCLAVIPTLMFLAWIIRFLVGLLRRASPARS
ncbi:MAG: hypothetical protein JZU65_15565 [Chlorobium sp.]|nr:hypothetical protein [Chlorobium sp.]